MKAILVWPDYFEDDPEDTFWLECEYLEATDILLPEIKRRFPNDHQQAAEDIESFYHDLKDRGYLSFNTDLPWKPGCVYFLISRSLRLIKPMPHYFPYSGQWGAYCPFITIRSQAVKALDELGSVDATIVDVWDQDNKGDGSMNHRFSRMMDEKVYTKHKDDIKKLVARVKEIEKELGGKVKVRIPILFSSDDTYIRLYVQGYVLNIQFYKRDNAFKLVFSEKLLLNNCEYKVKTSILEFDAFLLKLKDYVKEILFFSNKNPKQKERMLESELIAEMQKGNNDVLAIDMEVTVSNSNQYNCIVRNGQTATSNPEMDLLLVVKREANYYLLPVEIKLGNGKTKKEGPAEIASSINILSDDEIRSAIVNTYTENIRRYKEVGICNTSFGDEGIKTFEYDHHWCSGVIVIIDENQKPLSISDVTFDCYIKKKCPNINSYKVKEIHINKDDFIAGHWINAL